MSTKSHISLMISSLCGPSSPIPRPLTSLAPGGDRSFEDLMSFTTAKASDYRKAKATS